MKTSQYISTLILLVIAVLAGFWFGAGQETESNVYNGPAFSFTYPDNYEAVHGGLILDEDLDRYTAVGERTPIVLMNEVDVVWGTGSVDSFVGQRFNLGVDKLSDFEHFDLHEQVTIGEREFTRVRLSEHFTTTGYYTSENGIVVGFQVSFVENDNEELREIISTLEI